MKKRGPDLTDREQNVVRVVGAAILAICIAISAMLGHHIEPVIAMVMIVPGFPVVVFNIVAWRKRMHW